MDAEPESPVQDSFSGVRRVASTIMRIQCSPIPDLPGR